MKKMFLFLFMVFGVFLTSCKKENQENVIRFAVSADYPPFEFLKEGELTGFDIELAKMVGEKLGKTVEFEAVKFSTIFFLLQSQKVDAAISTITKTEEREKQFDFSNPYYFEKIAVVYRKEKPFSNAEELTSQKIGGLLGSVQEIWMKKNIQDPVLTLVDHTNQAIESLKAGHVDAVVIDGVQAVSFVNNNEGLGYNYLSEAEDGFCVALPKGSKLKESIDQALKELNDSGKIDELKAKWTEGNA
jgi:polar amino acid transport system substrate-binding protein